VILGKQAIDDDANQIGQMPAAKYAYLKIDEIWYFQENHRFGKKK